MKGKNSKELKNELHKYVLQTADELVGELKNRKQHGNLRSNDKVLCMK